MQVPAEVFKAYDIRGIVGRTLDAGFAEQLGRAFGSAVRAAGDTGVAVGRDGRLSGPELSAALIRGLVSTGLNVVDLGPVTTPMLYYVAATRSAHGCSSGIQVTGSHNPKDYNGFKMVVAGRAIHGEEIQALRRRMEAGDHVRGKGRSARLDIGDEYTARIAGDCRLARPMKVAVDSGNGIAGASGPGVLRALGCTVQELYSEVDGDFPNHHPDPSKPENLRELIEAVQQGDAEIGLAFDGDGDRLGVVTKSGEIVYPDRQLMLFARDVLKRNPGAPILYDVKCTQQLAPLIRAAGGEPVMWKTGHSLVKARMKELASPLAGEMSGHIFFGERWYGFDDATYTAGRLLEILSQSADPSAVLEALPKAYSTPELNVACREGEPAEVMAQLRQRAQASFPGAREIITIDGVRAEFDDGFALVRASNTTPVLVLRFEGTSQEALDRVRDAGMAALRAVKPDAEIVAAAH